MRYFKHLIEPSNTDQELICFYKRKLAWELWKEALEKKILAYKNSDNCALLWLEPSKLRSERLDFLSGVDAQLSAPEALSIAQKNVTDELEKFQGDTEKLLEDWCRQCDKSKNICVGLEIELCQMVSMPARIVGELTHLIITQPLYAFASTHLAARASSRETLDDLYTNIFKHLTGFSALALEIGIYFYFNQLRLYSIQVFQMLIGGDLVLAQLHLLTSKYMPQHELSVSSCIKNNKFALSILFFLIQQCWFEPSLSQGLIKWGTLAVAMMACGGMSKKVSAYVSNTILPQDASQKASVMRNMMQQLLWLVACIYLYPFLIQNLECIFLAVDDSKYKAALGVLGLDADATPQKIREQFRAATRKCHPDLNSGLSFIASSRCSEMKAAAETLKEVRQLRR